MKKRGLALAVVSAMLIATLGACGGGAKEDAGKSAESSVAGQSQEASESSKASTENLTGVDAIIAEAQNLPKRLLKSLTVRHSTV